MGDAGTILRSDDVGATWKAQITPSNAWLTDVSFGDAEHGIAVGEQGTVLRTSDGGTTWSVLVTSTLEDHQTVLMNSSTEGWILTTTVDPAASDPSTNDITSAVLHTADGGATWTEQMAWSGVRLRDLSFAGADDGWAVGDDNAVYRTDDGGESWQAIETEVSRGTFFSVCARTSKDIWLVGDDDIVHSADGGSTWSHTSFGWYDWEPFAAVSFRDADHGVVVGGGAANETDTLEAGVILTTHDGGASWTQHHESYPLEGTLAGVAYADDDHLCCVGESGAALYSRDGGTTWAGRAPCAWRPLYAVDAVGMFMVAVGVALEGEDWRPLVAHSTDGGSTWKQRPAGSVHTVAFNAVDVVTAKDAYAVGDFGTIACTTTRGKRWSVHSFVGGTSQDLLGVAFANRTAGWAVGRRGTILHATDGRRWTRQASGTREVLLDVASLGRRRALAVGADGVALRTTNGGATWRRVRTRTKADLSAVDFVDGTRGWTVGVLRGDTHTNVVLHTADGGRHWSSVAVPFASDDDVAAVDFVTRRQGWIATDHGYVYGTNDGGQSWKTEFSGVAYTWGLVARATGEAWLVGANCAIARRTP